MSRASTCSFAMPVAHGRAPRYQRAARDCIRFLYSGDRSFSAAAHQASPAAVCAAESSPAARSFSAAVRSNASLPFARRGRPFAQSPVASALKRPTARFAAPSSGFCSSVFAESRTDAFSLCRNARSFETAWTRAARSGSFAALADASARLTTVSAGSYCPVATPSSRTARYAFASADAPSVPRIRGAALFTAAIFIGTDSISKAWAIASTALIEVSRSPDWAARSRASRSITKRAPSSLLSPLPCSSSFRAKACSSPGVFRA